jgi:hypothetical protein
MIKPDGNPDRIDFHTFQHRTLGDMVVVTKFWRSDGRDRALNGVDRKEPGFDLEWALAWCEQHGYTVHRWLSGARAWQGKPWVIRTAAQIKHKRERLEKRLHAAWKRGDLAGSKSNLLAHDLAYDL